MANKRHLPGLDELLAAVEKTPFYRLVVWIWGYTPDVIRGPLLRRVNPTLLLGALAVIIDPATSGSDSRVLLGWHPYRVRDGHPWQLPGGALKNRDREVHDPRHAVIREVQEELDIEVEVVRLLAIDVDYSRGIMDFYFECALKKDYPELSKPMKNPEMTRIEWFNLSNLPGNMHEQQRRFLEHVLPGIPDLPGVNLTACEEQPEWWDRLSRAKQIHQDLVQPGGSCSGKLDALVREGRALLDCDILSLFALDRPIAVPSFRPNESSDDIPIALRLLAESSSSRGTSVFSEAVPPAIDSRGLTASLLFQQPYGTPIRLHEGWLQNHERARSWQGHDHLTDRECHSLIAMAVVLQRERQIVGLLKAENKFGNQRAEGVTPYMPFTPDDGHIFRELVAAARGILVQRGFG